MTDRSIERIHANGTIRALRLSTGEIVEADDVVVGIGVAPDVGWLVGSGLSTAAGIPGRPARPYGQRRRSSRPETPLLHSTRGSAVTCPARIGRPRTAGQRARPGRCLGSTPATRR